MKCEIEHNQSHPIINFKNIFPDEEKIKNDLKIFKQKIDKFKEEIEKFVDKLHDISKNIDKKNLNAELAISFIQDAQGTGAAHFAMNEILKFAFISRLFGEILCNFIGCNAMLGMILLI